MQALTFAGKEAVSHTTVPDPQLKHPTDVIVKVTLSSICGSDLHVYHGREIGIDLGTVMGHEFVGVVEERGADVKKIKKGTRVLSPFTTSCGECFYCRIGLTCRCEKGHLFGWMHNGEGLQGAQAAYIRVPMADSTLLPLSSDISEKKGLLLGDVFSTGFFCAENAGINAKGVYAVIGCGPVGLMTILAAKHLGADKLFAIDYVADRVAIAQKFGAIALHPSLIDVKEKILEETQGRGADAVMEVVGTASALKLAIDLLRPGGIISSVGVHTEKNFAFSPSDAYDKNVTYKIGRCPARYYAEKLLREDVPQRYSIDQIITHEFELKNGAEAYKVFDQKMDNCIKAVLVP